VVPGWPKRVDGFPFYESPVIADVAGQGTRAAIEGNDTYWVHAFGANGLEQPGFPKYTGQWMGFAAAIADPLMNGQLHYSATTREGEVFDWTVLGDSALNNNWWHSRHDEHNSGAYGTDTRRPASVLDLSVSGTGPYTLTWTAPGDDYMVGTANKYDVRWSNSPITSSNFWSATPLKGAPAPTAARSSQHFSTYAPAGSSVYFALRTTDRARSISALGNVVCTGSCSTSHTQPISMIASQTARTDAAPRTSPSAPSTTAVATRPAGLLRPLLPFGAVVAVLAVGLQQRKRRRASQRSVGRPRLGRGGT
jgi:hypothetical protein